MNNRESEIVMFNGDEAAKFRTGISGWVSRLGHFYGNDERAARYDGCTHRPCKDCGTPVERGWLLCKKCRETKDVAKYNAMPKEEWNEKGMLYYDAADRYFADWDEVEYY